MLGLGLGLGNHPLHDIFEASCKPLSLTLEDRYEYLCGSRLAHYMVKHVIQNPDHQIIHYKFTHKYYLIPQRLQQMKLRDNPYCDFCPDNTIATFYHMVWQCPEIN